MSDKVSLMLKVDRHVKDLLIACAAEDRRTMSGQVEMLIENDAMARYTLVNRKCDETSEEENYV